MGDFERSRTEQRKEEREGYPNLAEVCAHHIYHFETFAGFACVTPELLAAALRGEEVLTAGELLRIARFTGIPFLVLNCPRMIWMDSRNYRHVRMCRELEAAHTALQVRERAEGQAFCGGWVSPGTVEAFLDAFARGKATLGWYLGVKEALAQSLRASEPPAAPRGLTRRTE